MSTLSGGQASSFVEEIRSALLSANLDNDMPAIKNGIKLCNQRLRVLNTMLQETSLKTGERQHLITCMSHLKSFKQMFNSLRIVGGGSVSRKQKPSDRVKWEDLKSAFANRIRTSIVINLSHKDVAGFLNDAQGAFTRRINNMLKKTEPLKVNAVFCGEFIIVKNDIETFDFKYLNTKNSPIYRDTDINTWFKDNVTGPILTQLQEFQEKQSGWALSAIVNIMFNINKFTPQLGSSYIELPKQIKKKEACINVRNNDEGCFGWAVVSALYPVKKNSERVTKYPHYSSVLNLKNIVMPMTIKQIPRFEAQNGISVNVYILEKSHRKNFNIVPTYLTKNKREKHVNLLLIQNIYEDEDHANNIDKNIKLRYHYLWIKDLSRLLSSQLSNHNGRVYVCDRCLHYFKTEAKHEKHYEECIRSNDCKIKLPTENATIQFKNHKNKVRAPFIVYADLECLLVPSEAAHSLHEHTPYSVGYYLKCSYDDSLSFYRSYRGENCQKWFVQEMKQLAENIETVFLCPLPMDPLTPEQETEFHHITHCHICEQPFDISNNRVRDHDHLTGIYRGAAHEGCNINYQDSHIIPVVFHNLSGYDSHFIIKDLATNFKGRVDLLPINKEHYISFTKHIDGNLIKFRFIDSYRFLAEKLDTLASYLTAFPNLKSQFKNINETDFKLLTRKGVFPYDFVDSFSKLNETQLPNKSEFYNSLTDSDVTMEDYMHANTIWHSFSCKNLGEYSDLYMKTDILLLADVFEQFRTSCMHTYSLDPAHYFTLPGYTWDCMLKYTKINLELLTDVDMLMFIERGIRGGLSQSTKRHSVANNKYLPNYQSNKPSKFLIYNDINNQYGWAMSQALPYGGFEWVEGSSIDLNNIAADSSEGYILEVDLEYPQNLHDMHKDLPFCPEHRITKNLKETKLLATLYNKERYVIHYRNLQQALANGLILTKIHRVLKFKQAVWLKPYIDLNTKLRAAATNDFDKNLFKYLINAAFGKMMENVRKHSIVKLVTHWEGRYGAEALIAKPNFKSSAIFDDDLVAIELNKTEVYFNKPIYVGMCILDISKLKLYDFHYSYMLSRFGDKARVCYTDTDSLIYEVECDDLYQVIRQDAYEYFDTSDYPENNIYNIPRVNRKALGFMKDENSGKVMTEFVGLRSKLYSTKIFRSEEDEKTDKDRMMRDGNYGRELDHALENLATVKKAKGVKKHIVRNRITFNDYLACLIENKQTVIEQKLFKSENHQVSTIKQTKVALSPHDDKRFIITGTCETLPWGHYAIMNQHF